MEIFGLGGVFFLGLMENQTRHITPIPGHINILLKEIYELSLDSLSDTCFYHA